MLALAKLFVLGLVLLVGILILLVPILLHYRVCAPEIAKSPTDYMMVVKLCSAKKEVLATFHKGPVRLHPTGKWRDIELSIRDYSPEVQYIELADSGSSENDNVTMIAGTALQLGHHLDSAIEVFSLPHRDSSISRKRTCLVLVDLPKAYLLFHKWKIEYSTANSGSSDASSAQTQEFFAPVGTGKVNRVSLNIPTAAVHMRIHALGKHGTREAVGEVSLPSFSKFG